MRKRIEQYHAIDQNFKLGVLKVLNFYDKKYVKKIKIYIRFDLPHVRSDVIKLIHM